MLDEEKMKAFVAICIEHCKKIAPYDLFKGSEEEFEAMCLAVMKVGVGVFLDSLWHDASEEPDASRDAWLVMQTGKDLIEVHKYGGFNKDGGQTWQQQAERGFVIRWAYLDDILPKEGGEE